VGRSSGRSSAQEFRLGKERPHERRPFRPAPSDWGTQAGGRNAAVTTRSRWRFAPLVYGMVVYAAAVPTFGAGAVLSLLTFPAGVGFEPTSDLAAANGFQGLRRTAAPLS